MPLLQPNAPTTMVLPYYSAPTPRPQGPGRQPHVLLCVEDVHSADLLCVVLEALGWQTTACNIFEWLDGDGPIVAPDLLVVCTWPLRNAPIVRLVRAQLARYDAALILFLDSEADRELAGIFRAVRSISPFCSLDELITCFEDALQAHWPTQPLPRC